MPEQLPISVIMAVYNAEAYLRASVESILGQSCGDFEFIIVDDASTDGTTDLLVEYAGRDRRIHLLRNETNLRQFVSLNKGIAVARGRYLARQDGDDVSFRGRLEAQRAYLDQHHEVGLLGTAHVDIDAQGLPVRTTAPPPADTGIRWRMLWHNAFCHTSVMFRREILSGGFPLYQPGYLHTEDYELWSRMLARTQAANLSEPLVFYRTHAANVSSTWPQVQADACLRIAARNIAAVASGAELTADEIGQLRAWMAGFPARMGSLAPSLGGKCLQILEAFARQPGLDHDVVRKIRTCWEGRVRTAVGEAAWAELNLGQRA